MVLVRQRTQLKNRIHATLAKYALHDLEVSDLFGVRGRARGSTRWGARNLAASRDKHKATESPVIEQAECTTLARNATEGIPSG